MGFIYLRALIRQGYLSSLKWSIIARYYVEEGWRRPEFGLLLVIVAGIFAVIWEVHIPAPGYAVGALGLAAAVMALRNPTGLEKFLWLFFLTMFLVIELKSIDNDRSIHAYEQSLARAEQLRQFGAIADRLNLSIATSGKQFRETMKQTRSVLLNITGGESYAVLLPMVHDYEANVAAVPIAVENHGEHPLNGATVTVYSSGVWMAATKESILQSVANRLVLPTLYGGERLVLSPLLRPDAGFELDEEDSGRKALRVIVYITGQNFGCIEYLDFRRAKDGHWEFKYMVYKQQSSFPQSRGGGQTLLEKVGWSSDPNSLHFTRPPNR